MKFENVKVYGFEGALRGMRNPLESWNKSDSFFGLVNIDDDEHDYEVARSWVEDLKGNEDDLLLEEEDRWLIQNGLLEIDFDHQIANVAFIGPKDMSLARRLIAAGPEHRKFLRQIMVSVDITAPLYIWKEFDTYKINVTANSTSTMHKLTSKPITRECFEMGDYEPDLAVDAADQSGVVVDGFVDHWHTDMFVDYLIEHLEDLRQMYVKTKDKRYWKELVRWLPESWMQTRTITMNYENVRSMVHQRKNHKLIEWSGDDENSFINFAKKLPYAEDLIFD